MVKVFVEVGPKNFEVEKVIDSASVYALLEHTIKSLDVVGVGILILLQNAIQYDLRHLQIRVRELVVLGPSLGNVCSSLLNYRVEVSQQEHQAAFGWVVRHLP